MHGHTYLSDIADFEIPNNTTEHIEIPQGKGHFIEMNGHNNNPKPFTILTWPDDPSKIPFGQQQLIFLTPVTFWPVLFCQ